MRLVIAALLPLMLPAQDASTSEFFETRVRPLLAEKCYACHGPKVASGNLRLDSRDAVRKGGNRGPAVVPGQIDLSVLARAISYRESDLKMPPSGRLRDDEIATLTAWIRAGATDPRDGAAPAKVTRLWSLEPYRAHAAPKTVNQKWSRTWIDPFVLARLESAKLAPAPEADRRAWIRRVTFDLTGLPPSPPDIEVFLSDRSFNAHGKVVERLLASPHYGERWARHWLDLARYAETDGHEFDREKPNAWRYRDYVIRAFNADLPYDQFVKEQIAGDLLPQRTHGRSIESTLGTGFFALYEERNAADDLGEVRAEKLDNQIDTFGKTFLGLTIACARCHDHKFDPIPTRDYYALGGVLASKQVIQGALDSPDVLAGQIAILEQIAEIRRRLPRTRPKPSDTLAEAVQKLRAAIPDARAQIGPWLAELVVALRERDHPLHPLAAIARGKSADAVRKELGEWNERAAKADPSEIEMDPRGWRVDGPAYALREAVPEATGFLTSKTFRVERKYLHVRLAGSSDATSGRQPGQLRVSLVGDGRDATFTPDGTGRMLWRTAGMGKMFNELAYVEVADRSRTGHLQVDRIVFSDSREPPAAGRFVDAGAMEIGTVDEMIARYQQALAPAISESVTPTQALRDLAARLEEPQYGLLSVEDEARNLRIHKSGNHRNLGDEVPRGFLTALGGTRFSDGSGRPALADALTSPSNPLTARVFVNRVWKHHFGQGLVRTTDNFGSTGERPSHPELLDTLAARFVASGWRVKDLHRTIVLSATYLQSSRALPAASDPENRLLHRMPVRRLEAESIRDSILAVSGALDPAGHGPPVPPHISEYQDGRGKPPSGPLDGARRRSIYTGVRRNFLPPLYMAFDYPPTVTTMGRRGTSTVPSQALILMNNEFVQKQAAVWAATAASTVERKARIEKMFLAAYGRPAEAAEIDQSLTFLATQEKQYTENGQTKSWTDFAHSLINSKEFIFIP